MMELHRSSGTAANPKAKLNYSEFRATLPTYKRHTDAMWTRILLRPLSLPVGWVMYRAGLSGNAVSLLGLVGTLAGAAMLAAPGFGFTIASLLLLNLVALLDCVDGNIARAAQKTGPSGDFLDAIVGYTVYAVAPIALGVRSGLVDGNELSAFPVLLGGLAAVLNSYTRVIHHKFEASVGATSKAQHSGTSDKFSFAKKFSGEIGLGGFMVPLLTLAVAFRWEVPYLLSYTALYVAIAIYIVLSRVRLALQRA